MAEVPQWATDAGTVAGIVIAVLGALALVSKSPPVRWAWRTVVADPATHWLTRTIRAEIDPVKATLDDVAAKNVETSAALVVHMDGEVALREADMKHQGEWRDEVRADIGSLRAEMRAGHAELGGRVDVVHERLDETLVALAAGNPELRPGQLEPDDDARPIYAPAAAAAASGLIGPPPRRPTIRPEDA